jgi:hypothetical protein
MKKQANNKSDKKIINSNEHWNFMNDLELVEKLSTTKYCIKKQENIFNLKTGKSRATFHRYRLKLNIRSSTKLFDYSFKNLGLCYFCQKKSTIIHHINQNRKDNSIKNLVNLCRSCHNKIHRLLVNSRKVSSESNVRLETKMEDYE